MTLASVSRETLAWVAAVAVLGLLFQTLVGWGRRRLRRRALGVRMQRAALGEARAAGLLRAAGYTVLGSQVAAEHAVQVDDRRVTIALRATISWSATALVSSSR